MLDSPNLQSPADLNSLYGDWSTLGAMQGHQNQDLAAQFRQQAYQANANDIDRTGLANTLSAATMPSDIQIKGNTANQGTIKTQQDALGLTSAQDAYGDKQSLLHKTLAREMSDEDLTTESNKYVKAYQQAQLSGNRAEADKYHSVLDTLVGAATAKAADRVQSRDVANNRNTTAIQEAGINSATQTNVAGIHAGAQVGVATLNDAERAKAAADKLSLQNAIRAEYDKPPAQRDQSKIDALTHILQVTSPSYGPAVSLPDLAKGKLRRNADGSEADGSAEKPYKLD
jgi:hypothetical protein